MVPPGPDDLHAIAEYISFDSAFYSKTVVRTILKVTRNMSRFPFAGRMVPELNDKNIREIVLIVT